jgi:hypothetical protein
MGQKILRESHRGEEIAAEILGILEEAGIGMEEEYERPILRTKAYKIAYAAGRGGHTNEEAASKIMEVYDEDGTTLKGRIGNKVFRRIVDLLQEFPWHSEKITKFKPKKRGRPRQTL